LVGRTKELLEEGNVRRLIIRNREDEVLLEVPLTAGVAVGGVVTLVAPVLAALGALAALLTHVKVEIVRTRSAARFKRGLKCLFTIFWTSESRHFDTHSATMR
jgi:hypothetical protein